jgi:hypothetical protein
MPAHLNPDAPLHGVWRKQQQRRVQNAIFKRRRPVLHYLEEDDALWLDSWTQDHKVTQSRFWSDLLKAARKREDPDSFLPVNPPPPVQKPWQDSDAVFADLDFST